MIKLRVPKINLSLQLVLVFVCSLLFGDFISIFHKSLFFSISLTIKDILVYLLPFVIFSCLFYSMVANQSRAFRFVILLLGMVSASNLVSILTAFWIGRISLPHIALNLGSDQEVVRVLEPLWTLSLPTLVSNEVALILGFGLGIVCSIIPYKLPILLGRLANESVTWFLQKIFIPILPIFALGFILKMQYEGNLARVLKEYAPIVMLLITANIFYLSCLFLLASRFNFSKWLFLVKNTLPAGLLGFMTMSSLASMPVTLTAAEKNTNNKEAVRAIIPATVNIHMIGDSISIPIIAMGVLLTFGHDLPNFTEYLIFTQFFMLAKFAVPAIPCGSMLVMLPIFEQYLGFTSEMSAFIAAIYILFDPIITAANVLGNSAFAIMFCRILGVPANKSLKIT